MLQMRYNGDKIQIDIPSMRRNQIISDVFSRLGFMERRGSGIDRILDSYAEVAQKPTFYSDADFFIVTLPNRSVATPSQTSMESVESVHSTSLSAKELAAFKERLKELPLTSSTKDCTAELFRRYGFEYTFHAVNVADVFKVKTAGAYRIVKKLRDFGIIESPQY